VDWFADVDRIGAGVVDALLADGTFKVRAVTRKLDSEKALKLKARGVDVVFADLNSKDTAPLDKAMEGSEVVFGVSPYSPPRPRLRL
jgi:uncharacterized protein YbjT (DUF2867 family)